MTPTPPPLPPLIAPEPYELSADAAKFFAELNGQWQEIQTRRARHDAERDRLAAIHKLKLTDKDLEAKRRLKQQDAKLLQEEIALLDRLNEWREIRRAERHAAFDRETEVWEQAAVAVRERMGNDGFDPAAYAGPDPYYPTMAGEKILQDAAMYHQSVSPHKRRAVELDRLRFMDDDIGADAIAARINTAAARLDELLASL